MVRVKFLAPRHKHSCLFLEMPLHQKISLSPACPAHQHMGKRITTLRLSLKSFKHAFFQLRNLRDCHLLVNQSRQDLLLSRKVLQQRRRDLVQVPPQRDSPFKRRQVRDRTVNSIVHDVQSLAYFKSLRFTRCFVHRRMLKPHTMALQCWEQVAHLVLQELSNKRRRHVPVFDKRVDVVRRDVCKHAIEHRQCVIHVLQLVPDRVVWHGKQIHPSSKHSVRRQHHRGS
mmetsp:Transcript_8041/g.17288  ORF Transcript_8041/g.17288 Transcript_8041/m.17288 type:complete len:228 (-) Transcript_8041:753-1436(-)